MLFELIKNSLRAVQERFADSEEESQPIRIVVADGLEDVTIKVGALPTRAALRGKNPCGHGHVRCLGAGASRARPTG